MKKITLRIAFLMALSLFAFQAQGQIDVTEIYNLQNFGNGQYLTSNNTSTYQVTNPPITGSTDLGLNFQFYIAETGATDYNIDCPEFRGIMRGTGTGSIVHTNFQPTGAGGAIATDKRWIATSTVDGSDTLWRFQLSATNGNNNQGDPITPRYLYLGTDGVYYNISVANMNDETIAYTDGEARSQWLLQVSNILNNEDFDKSSIFISNPVNNQLSIKGLTANVNEISVYSLLGKQILTRNVDGQSSLTIDVSALTSGMYLVKMEGDNGAFTKKIVKQ